MEMQTFNFLDQTYQVGGGRVMALDDAVRLEELSGPDLVKLHNLVVANLGEGSRVNRFANKERAVERTAAKLAAYSESDAAPEPEAPKAKAKAERKKRQMHFHFPWHGEENFKGVRSKTSLRGRVIELMLDDGATFEEVVTEVHAFDNDRGSTPGHVERRAYEVVRIIHYYVGYGMYQTADGKIHIHKGKKT